MATCADCRYYKEGVCHGTPPPDPVTLGKVHATEGETAGGVAWPRPRVRPTDPACGVYKPAVP